MPTASSIARARASPSAPRDTREIERQAHVLRDREMRQQVKSLEHEAHALAAQQRARGVIERGEVDAVEHDRARVRHVESRDQVEQRRFADAGLAHDRDELAAVDESSETVAQDLARAHAAVGFRYVADEEHRHAVTITRAGSAITVPAEFPKNERHSFFRTNFPSPIGRGVGGEGDRASSISEGSIKRLVKCGGFMGAMPPGRGASRRRQALERADAIMRRTLSIDTKAFAMRTLLLRLCCAAIAITSAAGAHAQAFPTRSVRLIVPFSAGGAADVPGRILAHRLTESLGQQVIIDNRPGAGSTIGAETAAKLPPDGYTPS